jgi:sugar lactone lactonase YvrE
VGGTSWSAPTWAAFCALINQARQSASPPGPPLGFLNPKLYALQGTPAIVDVQGGHSNDSYPATQGFDLCTGLGSPNIAAMIQLIGNADAPLVLLGQSGWQMVTYGQTATFAVSTYPAASQLTFQWQGVGASVGGVEQPWANLTDNADYAGTKTPVLSVANVEPNQGEDNFFRCVVSDGVSSITSTEAYLEAISTGVTTLAGWPQAGGTADGTGRAARFDFVGSVRLDSQGNIYVADAGNNTVRKVTPGGVVTTVAGTPEKPGSQDGPATQALFDDPAGVAVDASGNLYVADSGNYTIRKIEMPSGLVSTLAGSPGVQGTASGTGGNAQFYDMQNIAADNFGNLYVADGMSDTVRKVVIATGAVTTFAGTAGVVGSSDGTGGESRWNDPTGIATDAAGNVYVSDTGNCTVRKITPSGVVTTIAGIPGVPWSQVGPGLFTAPAGLSVDSSGNIFVGDVGTYRISEISPGGAVTPVAGSAQGAVDGPPSSAEFWFPCDVAVDPDGAIYVADGYNDTVRRVAPSLPAPSFALGLPQYPFVNVGSTVVFSRVVTGATSYQWLFDGAPISDSPTDGSVTTNVVSGATGDHLVISNCTYAAAGSYSLEAFGPGGITQVISSADVLSLGQTAKPGTISSISSRAYVGTGNNILIGGFYVVGNTSATVLVQAIGPALSGSPFNVSGVLQHPTLTIHQYQNGNDVVLYQDTGWGSSQVLLNAAAAVYAQPVLSPGSADSELLVTLPPGGYTAEVVGADGGTGVALCGIYQLP